MSDYNYNYDENNQAYDQGYDQGYDQNYDQGYDQGYDYNAYSPENNFQDVSLPPVPTTNTSTAWSATQDTGLKVSTPPPPPVATKKKEKEPIELYDLEGWRAYLILGFFAVGNLPIPFVNPNFFKYIFHSGHYILIPVSIIEFIFLFFVLFWNALLSWFYLAGTLSIGVKSEVYIALRILWAHVAICIIPLIVLSKYFSIFKASTESALIIKAPLYIVFLVFSIITLGFYISMWSGIFGSGIFTGVFLLIGGLVNQVWFSVAVGVLELLASISWLILIAFCVVQIIGMIRSFVLFRRAQKEAKAQNTQVSV